MRPLTPPDPHFTPPQWSEHWHHHFSHTTTGSWTVFMFTFIFLTNNKNKKKQQQLHRGSRVDWYAALYFPSALRSNHTLPAQLPGRWRIWVFHPRTWTNKTVDQRNEPHTVGREMHLSNPLTYSHLQDQSHFTEQYKWLLTRCCDSTGSWDHEGITADDCWAAAVFFYT